MGRMDEKRKQTKGEDEESCLSLAGNISGRGDLLENCLGNVTAVTAWGSIENGASKKGRKLVTATEGVVHFL
jgi:hypothetical protein